VTGIELLVTTFNLCVCTRLWARTATCTVGSSAVISFRLGITAVNAWLRANCQRLQIGGQTTPRNIRPPHEVIQAHKWRRENRLAVDALQLL